MGLRQGSPLQRVVTRRTLLRSGAMMGLATASAGSIGALLSACQAASPTATGTGQTGKDTLTLAVPASPPSLDGDFTTGNAYNPHGLNATAGLTQWETIESEADPEASDIAWQAGDPEELSVPDLAESWDVSADGLTYTFHLRSGIESSFGNEFTAEDVKWWLDRGAALEATTAFFNSVSNIKDWRVIDKQTFEVTLTDPTPVLIMTFNDTAFRHFVDSTEAKKHATASDPWATEWLQNNLPSFGPYWIDKLVPGQEVTWKTNPTYHAQPAIKNVVFRIVPDSSSRLALLSNGEVDVADGFSTEQLAQLATTPGVKVWKLPANEILGVSMNLAFPPLDDTRVRQALSYAVPYDAIVTNVYKGFALPSSGPFVTRVGGFDPSIYPYKLDLEKARSLLAEAGHPNGFSTQYVYNTDEPLGEQIGIQLRSSFEQIGVKLQLNGLPSAGWNEAQGAKSAPMLHWTVGSDVPDPFYQLSVFYRSDSAPNHSNYNNAELDDIIEQSKQVVDPSERQQLANRGLKVLIDDPAWLWIALPTWNVATRDNLAGVNWYPGSAVRWALVKFK